MPASLPALPASRHSDAFERLRRSVLEGPGRTDPELRQGVAAHAFGLCRGAGPGASLPAELGPYVEKVALSAYKVTDEDVESLREAGYSEDEVLELTLACALGSGLAVLDAGLEAASERS